MLFNKENLNLKTRRPGFGWIQYLFRKKFVVCTIVGISNVIKCQTKQINALQCFCL